MKLRKIQKQPHSADFAFFCPGCQCYHGMWTTDNNETGAIWAFNGNFDRPTFSPSIVVRYPAVGEDGMKEQVCHSFVVDGKIQYLNDCTHALAGQTVELPDVD